VCKCKVKIRVKKRAMPIITHIICFSKKGFGSTNEFIVTSPAETRSSVAENNIQSTEPEILLMEPFNKLLGAITT